MVSLGLIFLNKSRVVEIPRHGGRGSRFDASSFKRHSTYFQTECTIIPHAAWSQCTDPLDGTVRVSPPSGIGMTSAPSLTADGHISDETEGGELDARSICGKDATGTGCGNETAHDSQLEAQHLLECRNNLKHKAIATRDA